MQKDREIDHLMANQHGVIARAQAKAAGFSDRRIDRRLESGAWQRVFPSTYRLCSSPTTWDQLLTAAWLWAGSGAVVSHRAAAVLLGLGGIEAGPLEISVPRWRRVPSARVVLHTTTVMPRCDVQRIGCLTVTNASRTVIDLGAVVTDAVVAQALDDSIHTGLTSIQSIIRRLEDLGEPGRRGPGVLRRVLLSRDPSSAPTESLFEGKFLRLMRDASLPPPVKQYSVMATGFSARVDFAYPDRRLAIECDGFRFHAGRSA